MANSRPKHQTHSSKDSEGTKRSTPADGGLDGKHAVAGVPNRLDEAKTDNKPTSHGENQAKVADATVRDVPAESLSSVEGRANKETEPVTTRPVPVEEMDEEAVNQAAKDDASNDAPAKRLDMKKELELFDRSHALPNVDERGRVVPGVTKDGEPIMGSGAAGLVPPQPGTVTQQDAQSLTPAEKETVRKDEAPKREATLTIDGAMAYLTSRQLEGNPGRFFESFDSFARSEKEERGIRITGEMGTASNMAAYEASRMAENAAGEPRKRIDTMRAEIDRDKDALEAAIVAFEARRNDHNGEEVESDIEAAKAAHESYVAAIERNVKTEEARLKDVPEHEDAPSRQLDVLLPFDGKVTLHIV